MNDAQKWAALRELLGHIQDGSGKTVSLWQDKATGVWVVKVGQRYNYGGSIEAALTHAKEENRRGGIVRHEHG